MLLKQALELKLDADLSNMLRGHVLTKPHTGVAMSSLPSVPGSWTKREPFASLA